MRVVRIRSEQLDQEGPLPSVLYLSGRNPLRLLARAGVSGSTEIGTITAVLWKTPHGFPHPSYRTYQV